MTFDSEIANGGFWNYAKLSHGDRGFETYRQRVRQCGREWARAISETAPDIIICLSHGYWVASPWARSIEHRYTHKELAEQRYALYPAFLDGVLEGLGSRVTLADGCANTYPYMVYRSFRNFREWAVQESLKLTNVPHLFKKKMQFAMAIWPGFRSDRGGMWNPAQPEANFYTPKRLSHALHNAMAASDDFVWMWSGYGSLRWPS